MAAKIFLLFLVLGPLHLSAQNYRLVWSDEFDSTQLNTSFWQIEVTGSPANNELQYYTNRIDNIAVKNGQLVITALKESYGGRSYTSGRLHTNISWQYGKFEARIKLPYGQGMWPAFWMLGSNISSVGWPKCGEIDIMEMVGGAARSNGGDNKTFGTAHWSNNGSHAQYGLNYTLPSGKLSDDFHLFSCTWDPQKIVWFIDGIQYCVIDISSAGLAAFRAPFYIILNLAVGGDWPGSPVASTVFPQSMEVDYVRVYADASVLPAITMASPLNNAILPEKTDVLLQTTVNFSGSMKKVEFFQGVLKIGETTVAPYEMKWRQPAAGCYQISAKATTVDGVTASSSVINVKIGSVCGEAPYSGQPAAIPGFIEAENFDLGGQDVGYSDADAANNGGAYRPLDGVDIEACSDINGGFNVGWTTPNEWLNYTVAVAKDTTYSIDIRTANQNLSAGSLRIEVDGVDKTGKISIPSTGGWQTWQTVTVANISLPAGNHILRVYSIDGSYNLNWIKVYVPGAPSGLLLIAPNGGETVYAGSMYDITWSSTFIDSLRLYYSANGGTTWTSIENTVPAQYGFYRWFVPGESSTSCRILMRNYVGAPLVMSQSDFTIESPASVENGSPQLPGFCFLQNYPNPFNPSTTFTFSVPDYGHAALQVFNVLGQEVAKLYDSVAEPGRLHEIRFDAGDLPAGIYFASLSYNGSVRVNKLLFTK
jgi:beta-glucanase (GH16 family)